MGKLAVVPDDVELDEGATAGELVCSNAAIRDLISWGWESSSSLSCLSFRFSLMAMMGGPRYRHKQSSAAVES